MSVEAVPHDLLKVLDWRRHADGELLRSSIPEDLREWYKTNQLDIEGRLSELSLSRVVEGHHSTSGFWERMLSYSDRLSTVAGRFRLEHDYWYSPEIGLNPFLVRAYGEVKEWNEGERKELWGRILENLRYCRERGVGQSEAYARVNELLGEFPADSRFPYTSLKTHHWLADSLRSNRWFWEELKAASEGARRPVFKRIYMVRLSIADQEFHRARELRALKELREGFLMILSEELSRWSPLRIGDDLYLVCLAKSEVEEVLRIVEGRRMGLDVEIYEWGIERVEGRFRADGGSEWLYVVDSVENTRLSTAYEEFDYTPMSHADYTRILEGEYEYVAWVFTAPRGEVTELAQRFLDWGEGELERLYGDRRKELPERYTGPAQLLSPDLALAIAEGYDGFLGDCEEMVHTRSGGTIVRSFTRSLFVCGLMDESEGFEVYSGLADLKAKLHIPAYLHVTVSRPKYPFWMVAEISEGLKEDGLTFILGEKFLRLSDEDVSLLRIVSPYLRNVSRSQFHEVITRSRRASIEELKFFIEGKAADNKIHRDASAKLCWLIDELAKKYDGEDLRAIIWRALKALAPFTRDEKKWREPVSRGWRVSTS